MIWFTSDTHFNHKNVISYCNRPWANVDEMNEGLIKNWNERVGKCDHVYVLGDFHFGSTKKCKEILSRLKGYKILVKGNHDALAHKMIAAGFDQVLENEVLKLPNGERVFLSHFPFYPDAAERQAGFLAGKEIDMRYMHKRIVRRETENLVLLHGHVHQAWTVHNGQINVGVDVHDWKPLSHEQIQNMIAEIKG